MKTWSKCFKKDLQDKKVPTTSNKKINEFLIGKENKNFLMPDGNKEPHCKITQLCSNSPLQRLPFSTTNLGIW